MIVRFGFLVAASVAAYAVKQLNVKSSKSPAPVSRPSGNGELYSEHPDEAKYREQLTHSLDSREKGKKGEENDDEEEEEEEEVKLISSTTYCADCSRPDNGDEDTLPEPEDDIERFDGLEKEKKLGTEMLENASELKRLCKLVKEMEDRKVKLEGELLVYCRLNERESDIAELQRQLKIKTAEITMMNVNINNLQAERKKLLGDIEQRDSVIKELEDSRHKIKELQRQIQLDSNQMKVQLLFLKQQVSKFQEKEEEASKKNVEYKKGKDLKVEVMELERKNKELQHEKRELTVKLDAEIRTFRHANEDLLKQVEGLQMNRFSEVEELVYLRWVNACFRYELRNYQAPPGKISARDLNKNVSPSSQERAKQLMLDYAGFGRWQGDTDIESNVSHPSSPGSEDLDDSSYDGSNGKLSNFMKKPSLIGKLKKWGKSKDESSGFSSPPRSPSGGSSVRPIFSKMQEPIESPETPSPRNIRAEESLDSLAASFQVMSKAVEGVLDEKYSAYKDRHEFALEREKEIKHKAEKARAERYRNKSNWISKRADTEKLVKLKLPTKLPPTVPRTPPKLSSGHPPPPPPLPPPRGSLKRCAGSGDKVHRAPELVELYQTLMRREAKKDASSFLSPTSHVSDARSNMIREIEKRSSFLLAVKADVETQGDFVQSLANHVRAASFTGIEDLVAFVNWLDEELSFLVDERAVLKHFDWPEGKAEALRAAAFEYQDLVELEKQVTSFDDELNLPCEAALKRMYNMLEKVEQSVYALFRTRDMAIARYRDFRIPVDWLLDSGLLGKIKLSSVKLARKYMKRVASEVDAMRGPDKEPNREFLLLQGVRFAYRVHQFAGGFDAESVEAFEELRSRVYAQMKEVNKNEA